MAPHPVAVSPDVDDVAAVEQPVQERGGHHLVVQDFAPALEALIRGEHGGCTDYWVLYLMARREQGISPEAAVDAVYEMFAVMWGL